ncbi:MAG: hypothetical protein KA354_06400 [Phycisphaerae bacterium]|nr:hypothetical protein [Phycisphaerae bacterium]
MRRYMVCAVLAVMALVLLPGPATGQTAIRVDGGRSWTAASVADLIAAINASNLAGGSNTITLARGATFTLTAVNNTTNGPTGLPVIAANNNLTIRGSGATIARSTAPGTPAFRLFVVAPGAALTLKNLTLANGQVIGAPGKDAGGGAVLTLAGGALTASHMSFLANQAVGGDGGRQPGGLGLGGAIWNQGTATLNHDTFNGNQAMGGATRNPNGQKMGGLCGGGAVACGNLGTLTVSNCLFTGNQAIGGRRHSPSAEFDGIGSSGAIDNWGTAWITDSTFTDNQAIGGPADEGVDGGYSVGGAIGSGGPAAYSPVCTIQRCTFTRNQTIASDAGSPGNMDGAGIGGALSNGFSEDTSTMTVTDCSFTSNQALGGNGGFGGYGTGGVLNVESALSLASTLTTVANCTFTDNQAVGGGIGGVGVGGAIRNADWNIDDGSGATLIISNSTFEDNEATGTPGGDAADPLWSYGYGQSGAIDTSGNTTILNSAFRGNRAVGAALRPDAAPNDFNTACVGGALATWGGTLDIRESSFVGNQVIGSAGSDGGEGSAALGGAIEVHSGLPATIVKCLLFDNEVVGGAGGSGAPGGPGVGGGLDVEFVPWATAIGTSTTLTITDSTIRHNRAMGGAGGGAAMGGGYAVGTGVLFGAPDTSSVTLTGGSRVDQNEPDDAFQF